MSDGVDVYLRGERAKIIIFSPGHRDAGQRDPEESSASQCALVVVRLPLLLLHPGMLHVAGGLSQ